jgi:hypothetical protein
MPMRFRACQQRLVPRKRRQAAAFTVDELKLAKGQAAYPVIKATDVMVDLD